MAYITKCSLTAWQLPGTLWVFNDRKSLLNVLWMNWKTSDQKFFAFSIMENAYTTSYYGKNAYHKTS